MGSVRVKAARVVVAVAAVAWAAAGASPAAADGDPPAAPTNLEVGFTTTQVFLTWSGGVDVDAGGSYEVQAYDAVTGWSELPYAGEPGGEHTDFTHSQFRAVRPHGWEAVPAHWRIRAGLDGLFSDWAAIDFDIPADQDPPAPPGDAPLAPVVDPFEMPWDAAWVVFTYHQPTSDPVAEPADYEVQYLDGTVWSDFDTVNGPSRLDREHHYFTTPRDTGKNLRPVTRHWRMIAVDENGHESDPTPIDFVIPPFTTRPQPAVNLTFDGLSTTQFFVSYEQDEEPSPVDHYEVERLAGTAWQPLDVVFDMAHHSFRGTRPRLANSTQHWTLRMRPVNGDGDTPAGVDWPFPHDADGWAQVVVDLPPNADGPGSPLVEDPVLVNDDSQVQISWSQPEGPEPVTGYRLEASSGGGPFQPVDPTSYDVDLATSTILADAVPPFVEVDPDSVPADRLRVIAVVDDTLESWPSTVYVPVKVGKPSVAVHVGAQAIGLSWSSADARLDATYLVEEEDGADWVAVPGTSLSADGTTVGIPYEPVDADSTRTYRVTRVRHLADGAHASIPSDPVEAHLRVLPQAPTVIQPVCGGEAPVNCVESEAGNTYTIQWSPIPGDDTWPVAADRYEVEIALADGWLRLPDTAFPATAGQVDGVFQARADHRIDIYLRLVAVAADGRESLPSQAIDIYQPGEPPVGPDDPDPDAPPLSIRFVQTGEPEGTDVVTDDDRIPNDMLGYTDGAFGFTPGSNGMVDVHASVGDISITEGTRDNLLDTVIARTDINAGDCSEACEGNQGGPTYVDPATGEQITFYHSEDYRLGYTDSGGHFNAVGMAYAPAGSTAFERRGFVYETEQRRDSGHTNAESGTGQFVVKDGYIYLYFTDSPDDETVHHEGMGVARAPVAEVLAAARDDDHLQVPGEDGNPPAFDGLFKKYYDADPADDQPGAFSENAIGGRSTEVSKSGGGGSVVYDACMDEVWIVTADNIEGGPPPAPAGGWPVATSITVSPDGIHFDAPETIAITHGDRVYSTPAWRDARDPMVIRGDQFDVFARRHPRTDAARDDHTINRLSFRDTLASQGCLGQPDSNGDPAEPVRDTRPKLSVTPATTAYEQVGGGLARFDLSLDVPLDHDLTVSYWTSDRTATAVRGEYEPAGTQASPETLTIPAGDVQATVTVPVLDADAPVSYHPQYGNPLPEQFALHIRTADGTVQMGRTLGVATIIDRATPDGTVPWLRLTPTVQVHDGDSGTRTATVTLVLSQPVAQDVTVRLSTSDLTAHAGVHYEAVSGLELTIAAGQTRATTEIHVTPDDLATGSTRFTFSGRATAGPGFIYGTRLSSTITIVDDDA